ncbi:MAG: hypothetical protein NVSMB24_26290 [Mucilaginibacter sp.]
MTLFDLYQSPRSIHFISTNSGKLYPIKQFAQASRVYSDRAYKFVNIPSDLVGTIYIQTSNDDKNTRQDNLFSIAIEKGEGSELFYIFDRRVSDIAKLKWVSSSGIKCIGLLTTDREAKYEIFTKKIAREMDTVDFGGNQSFLNSPHSTVKACSMYLVALRGVKLDQVKVINYTPKRILNSHLLLAGRDSLTYLTKFIAHSDWLKSNGKKGIRLDLSNTKTLSALQCYNANLGLSDLSNLLRVDSVEFNSTNLTDVEFSKSNFSNVHFFNSCLDSSNFNKAKFINCSFMGASLKGTIFTNVIVKNVDFSNANMAGLIFEPDSIDNYQNIAFANNLDSITYRTNPGALLKLKERFRDAGLNGAKRKIITAIERRKHELYSSNVTKDIDYLLFDLTSSYGLYPFRPIIILLICIFLFYKLYLFLYFIGKLSVDIKHTGLDNSGAVVEIVDPINPGRLLFLSVITAFSIGFGAYTLNDWVKKLLKEDYIIQPMGWSKIIVGVQNLISLYLFALTILLFFGDPFSY